MRPENERSSVGRERPYQNWGREFESRLSLINNNLKIRTMKKDLISIGILLLISFCTFAQNENDLQNITLNRSTERPRTILLEGFTSVTCVPCVNGNYVLKNVLKQNTGLYALIKYQMNWPGNGDPYYTAEGGSRRSYYGVNSVPHIWLNGAQSMTTSNLNNNHLVNLQNSPAYMELDVDFYVEGQSVYARAIVNPTIDISGQNLKLYFAIVEKTTVKNAVTVPNQSNGEKEFDHVMKKFMPDANGILLGNMEANSRVIKIVEWEFKGNYRLPNNALNPINHAIEHSVEDFNNLTIIAWVQAQNKSIYQACNGIDRQEASLTFGVMGEGEIVGMINENPINSGDYLNIGDEITFTATPAEGYLFKEWRINGEVVTDKTANELNVTFEGKFLDINAIFHTAQVKVNYKTVNSFGNVSATLDDEDIESGDLVLRYSQINFTATPDEDYEVKEWKNNGTISGNYINDFIIESLDDEANVTVEFQTSKLNVNFGVVSEFGTISAIVDEEEIESGDLVFRRSKIIFTAHPNEGYEVKEWRNNNLLINGNNTNEYIVQSLNAVLNVTVDFQTTHLNVKFSAINNCGTLTASVNGENIESDSQVLRKSKVIFTAGVNEYCTVKEWINNNSVITGYTANEYIISSLAFDINVSVEFVETVGINKSLLLSNINLYPNPFTNKITISTAENIENVTITNILGQTVKEIKSAEKGEIVIDTKDLVTGIYFIDLRTSNGDVIVYKVVKKK